MRIRLTQLMLCFFLSVFFLSNAGWGQQDWPMANADRERSSWASQENVLHPPLQQSAWVPSALSEYCETLTWYNHLVIVGMEGTPNIFFALDDSTADTLWTFSVDSSGGSVDFVAAQNDSMAFFGGQGGKGLYAAYRSTGEEKWFRRMRSLYSRNPILDGDRLYIVGDSLYCLNIGDGSSVWSYPFSAQGTPALDDDWLCYVCGNQKVLAINKYTGVKEWEKYNSQTSFASLAIDEISVYTETHDSLVARFKLIGDIQWGYRVEGAVFPGLCTNTIAVCDTYVCFIVWQNASGKGQIFTLKKTDGSYCWDHEFPGVGVESPTIANRVVYAVSFSDHVLYGFDVSTGVVLFTDGSKHYTSQPVVANHRLYVGTDSTVVAFENLGSAVENDDAAYEDSYLLLQNFPNPFNPVTVIEFSLPRRTDVSLTVYNLLGQKVAQLAEGIYEPGAHSIEWDARNRSSGVYLCRMKARELTEGSRQFQKTLKIVLLR